MKIGTVVMNAFKFSLWNTSIANEWSGYYELVGDQKLSKIMERFGITGLTKCVKVGKLVYIYVGFDILPSLDFYKVNDYTVFYFREYEIEGKLLGVRKINNVKVFRIVGFWGTTWMEFVDWLCDDSLPDNVRLKCPKCGKTPSVSFTELRMKINDVKIKEHVHVIKCGCGVSSETIKQVASIIQSRVNVNTNELVNLVCDALKTDKKQKRKVKRILASKSLIS